MKEVRNILEQFINEKLRQIIISNPRRKEEGSKIKIRPVLLKDSLVYQETLYKDNKVFHENYKSEQITERILTCLTDNYRQCEISAEEEDIMILISKKGKVTVRRSKTAAGKDEQYTRQSLAHNRTKQYVLQEGIASEFLVGLGVQTPEGRIIKAKYDKFRQINRYLEFIEDILPKLPKDRTVRIIDFGCGKSYLTFALYYYLHELKGYSVKVTGLDLKEDVIDNCSKLAQEYGYDNLNFEKGDISTYEGGNAVDMVVTLHACDTATDYALAKAVAWGATVIMAVPCCQHEVNKQIAAPELEPILKYGLIKERVSALVTDAVRANLLEEQGYDVQILEFIDMEHTPKNLLIRAVRKPQMKKRVKQDIHSAAAFLHISTTLQKLFEQQEHHE